MSPECFEKGFSALMCFRRVTVEFVGVTLSPYFTTEKSAFIFKKESKHKICWFERVNEFIHQSKRRN